MTERIYVNGGDRIERTDLYLVTLKTSDGTTYEGLEPRRLFPLTDTARYISLLDEKEREVALVRDMKDLDAESRKALEDCFAEYYLIPKISRILSVDDKYGVLYISAKTDRGNIRFRIRNRHSDIKTIYGTNRVLFRDSNDNRYEIEDIAAIDGKSRRLLFSYI